MATRYSSLYAASTVRGFSSGADASTTSYSYKGAGAEKVGDTITISGSYDLANGLIDASNATLVLFDIPLNAKPITGHIGSGDDDVDSDNDFTYDLGYTGATTAIASAATTLQAGAEDLLDFTELSEVFEEVTFTGGEQMLLTRAAGETNTSGTIYFTFVFGVK